MTRASKVRIGSCSFDPSRAELLGPDGNPVRLRPQAMRLLETLLAHAGRVVTRDQLIAALWPGVVVTDDSLVQCVGDLRRALGSDQRLLCTVPRVGYRLDVAPTTDPAPDTDRVRHRLKSPRAAVALAGASLVIAALAWLVGHDGGPIAQVLRGGRGAPALIDPPTIAVRFRYETPNAALKESDATFAAGVADQLAADLVRNSDLRAVSVPAMAGDAMQGDLSRTLAARFVVEGQVQLRTTGLLLTAELIDASNASVLWIDRKDSKMESLEVDRGALLRRIARSVRTSAPHKDDTFVLPLPPRSLEPYLLVTRATARVYRFDRDEYRIARDELAQALQREPEYALAWAVRGYLDAVDAAAGITGGSSDSRSVELVVQIDRAIALDPRVALARQARSLTLVHAGRRADALKAAENALEVSPHDPQGHLVLANALVANGRMSEAMRAIDQAHARYPVPPVLFDFVRAKVLWGNDRFEEAVGAASRCLQRAPQFVACRAIRAVASDAMGRLEATREDLKEYRVTVPGAPTHTLGPGSYGVPKLLNNWLAEIRREIGLP